MKPSWKCWLVGIVVVVALSSAAAEPDAWCGCRGHCGVDCGGRNSSGYPSIYCATLTSFDAWTYHRWGCGEYHNLYAPTWSGVYGCPPCGCTGYGGIGPSATGVGGACPCAARRGG
jgi:hypothetical protein